MEYRLLAEFRTLFEGKRYLHRRSTQGDVIASRLYDDVLELGRSATLVSRMRDRSRVVNAQNVRIGIHARRGDGTFGELVPRQPAQAIASSDIARGPVATLEIGCEVKILAKAMIKQIDRVKTDLANQARQFRIRGDTPICIGIVGVNTADYTVGYERSRKFRTDGKTNKHPIQEAAEAIRRLNELARPDFDEFLILRYRATNDRPFKFEWVAAIATEREYGALLTRVSIEYERRFS